MAETVLGYRLEKGHSAADWSTRPLPEPWLRYAALDVELLIDLRDALEAELEGQGKLGWAHEEFAALAAAPPPPGRRDPWRRLSGIHRLRTPRQLCGGAPSGRPATRSPARVTSRPAGCCRTARSSTPCSPRPTPKKASSGVAGLPRVAPPPALRAHLVHRPPPPPGCPTKGCPGPMHPRTARRRHIAGPSGTRPPPPGSPQPGPPSVTSPWTTGYRVRT